MTMSPKSSRAASVRFIFMTILLDALGVGILIPVFPDVIRRFSNDAVFVNQYFGYFISVYALMQFVVSPILGGLSDRYGRRPVLLISLLFAGLDYLMMAFAPNLTILFLGRIIAGLTGASMTVASSYMVDISNDQNRSANFGLMGAAWGLGFIIGPASGGLLGSFGTQAPFIAAAVLNLLNFIFGYFILPESLPLEMRRKVEFRRMNPFTSLGKILKPSPIALLVWIFLLINLGGQSHPSIWTLYTEYKLNWSPRDVGLSLSFVGICIAVAQGWLTRIIIPRVGEARAVKIGLWFYIIPFMMFAIADKGWMMYAIILVFALSGISAPALQSMISRHASPQEQGELQGSLMSIGSLTAIVSPLIYTNLFAYFTSPVAPIQFSGAPYAFASVSCAAAYVLYLFAQRRERQS